jgi:DNA polymerase-3 subunit delta
VAAKQGWIWQSPGLSRDGVIESLRRWGRKRGIAVPDHVAAAAADSLPLDAGALFTELEKLDLYLQDRTELTEEDLGILAFSPDMDVFAFLRALQAGGQEYRLWKKIFRDQMSSQETVLPFLGLMLREARLLWQLASGEAEQVRLPARVRQEKTAMAKRLGLSGLPRIWTLLLEAESSIKSGQRTPDQAMEMLISGLLPLFRPCST